MPEVIASIKSMLTWLALPPVGPVVLLLLAAWWRRSARLTWRRIGMFATLLACVALWLLSSVGFAEWFQRQVMAVPVPLTPARIAELAQARAQGDTTTAIVVLGSGLRPMAPEYREADLSRYGLARLRYGVWLARQTGLPLGFCGGVPRTVPASTPSEAAIAQRILSQEYGQTLRWAESESRNTRENARYMAPMLTADGIRRVVLVTHSWHMPRALRAFRADLPAQVELLPAAMGHVAVAGQGLPSDRWLPSVEGLMQSRMVVREALGWLVGH